MPSLIRNVIPLALLNKTKMINSNNDDVISQVKNMMNLSGLWPKPKETFAYKLKTFISFLLSFIQMIFMIEQLAVNINYIDSVTDVLCLIATYASFLIKFAIFEYKRETFGRIIAALQAKSFTNYPHQFDHYTQNTIKISNGVCKMYQSSCLLVIMMYTLKPILIKEGQRLPIEVAFQVGYFYYLIYPFESISLLTTAWNNSSLDALAMGLLSIASAQLDILGEKLVNLDNEEIWQENGSESVEDKVKDCVVHHLDIIR